MCLLFLALTVHQCSGALYPQMKYKNSSSLIRNHVFFIRAKENDETFDIHVISHVDFETQKCEPGFEAHLLERRGESNHLAYNYPCISYHAREIHTL